MTVQEPKEHLQRLSRLFAPAPLYFITTCTHARRALLAQDAVRDILVNEWTDSQVRHGWAVGSYVIMPDHVHFFCRASEGRKPLPRWMQAWKQWTSKALTTTLSNAVPVWQPRFFDHVLRSDESYAEKWNYVFNNPVRAGLVTRAEDWRYYGSVHFD